MIFSTVAGKVVLGFSLIQLPELVGEREISAWRIAVKRL
jgi:hypothetical protein